MCRSCAEGGRRCANANKTRTYRTLLTERIARNKRVAAEPDISPDRRARLETFIARDEQLLSELKDAVKKHGEVVTPAPDPIPEPVHTAASAVSPNATVDPIQPMPTINTPADTSDTALRRSARRAGTVTGTDDDVVYVQTPDGTHVQLVKESPTVIYASDGIKVNLNGLLIDPNRAEPSSGYRLQLNAMDRRALAVNPDACLRGITLTSGATEGIDRETMNAIREESVMAPLVSDQQRRASWVSMSNGDRPDRGMANLRLAHFEGAYPGLSNINDADMRSGARRLARTMTKANVPPTVRAEMMAGYVGSHMDTWQARDKFIKSVIPDEEGQQRAHLYADTSEGAFPTDMNEVAALGAHAHRLGMTIRDKSYVSAARKDNRTAATLRQATRLDIADGMPKPLMTARNINQVNGMKRAPVQHRVSAAHAVQAEQKITTRPELVEHINSRPGQSRFKSALSFLSRLLPGRGGNSGD